MSIGMANLQYVRDRRTDELRQCLMPLSMG